MRFVLASASPARLSTLRHAGVEPEVVVSGVDEEAVTAPSAVHLVQGLAIAKAAAVATTISIETEERVLVLGCDSLLEFRGRTLGKPADADQAIARWKEMRGRSAALHTGHCLVEVDGGEIVQARDEVASTEVHFGYPSDAEIGSYVESGEPLRVAGGFTIDGLGGWFIERIVGDHHNVVGLSLPLLRTMLHDVGVSITDLPAVR